MTKAKDNAIITSTKSVALDKNLIKMEGEIRAANKSFLIIGNNLTVINETKLYKQRGFTTFESYVSTMFDFTRDYAYKIMNGCRVYNIISKEFKLADLPKTETHCRPLTKIEKDADILKIWSDVVDSGSIIAKTVINLVNVHLGKGTTPTPDPDTILDEGTGGGSVQDDVAALNISNADKVRVLEAKVTELENELEKARSMAGGIAKTKIARQMIQAGFATLVTTATDKQKKTLTATKKALLG